MIQFSQNGKTVVFYKNEGEKNYSFLIENEPALTEQLLSIMSVKQVKEKEIKVIVLEIFSKIESILLIIKSAYDNSKNPIVELVEKCQKKYGSNIKTKVVSKVGFDHCPVITVEIKMPDGEIFTASGANQKEAKKAAAILALNKL